MDVLRVNYQDPQAGKKFDQSIRETGFAIIGNHAIDPALFKQVYDEWKEFFDHEDKLSYKFKPAEQHGYFPFKSENAKGYTTKDLKEFFHFFPSVANLPKKMSLATQELATQLGQLGQNLLGFLDQNLPSSIRQKLTLPLAQMAQGSPLTLLRILHYPPITGHPEEGAERAAPHEDINLITLLPAATATGLQIKDPIEGTWQDVPCDPGAIIINAGDMLQEATGGYFISTSHRVVNPRGTAALESRYSMPFFVHPRSETRLSEYYTAGEFLDERLREIGLI